ncbi:MULTISPECIES: SulP family inorganic anion transporter [Deefgea]|uniref:STAS domain-containing protein n=1 Tax=Deefgea chitinilytica TaxID=570276 RepID=A0ABS2CBQ2_9NEIS|nr:MULTISPECIES: SulP family inorganic anion transporter [Deefgea]MBM5570863.1 STAS domain-containing protein [Deefgea chitinilytica]MBM9888092.1 SulP family inorganic anion transporter [Deefgea sp. CFH1-16]
MKLPILNWLPNYRQEHATGDLGASIIVALLLIPQSLAYAQLAGLPALHGLYASIVPVLIYALLGSSMTQSVGPMAITSAMMAAALAPLSPNTTAHYIALASTLTLLSGVFMLGFGALKLGKLTRILSIPVIQGFSAGTALLIALSQTGPLLSIQWQGSTALNWLLNIPNAAQQLTLNSAGFGLIGVTLLALTGNPAIQLLTKLQLSLTHARLVSRILPITVLLLGAWVLKTGVIDNSTIHSIGSLPSSNFAFTTPNINIKDLALLWLPALLIGLAGFLQSITIAQTIASERKETIDTNQELIALGGSNIAAAFVGGVAVSGGFSRTAVNASSGARTPIAGVLTAGWMCIGVLFFADVIGLLPLPLLAATIILATTRMLNPQSFWIAWRIDQRDGAAWLLTFVAVLLIGPINGIAVGVGVSLLLFMLRSSKPHIAVIGRVPGSEHFRNALHFKVEMPSEILAIRIDESLYFGNCAQVIEQCQKHLLSHSQAKHLILVLSAVNSIDVSAIAALKEFRQRLETIGITLHLAEVKGPVHETLQHSDFIRELSSPIFLSTHAAVQTLSTKNEDFSI